MTDKTNADLVNQGYRIAVGAPIIRFSDTKYAVKGQIRVLSYQVNKGNPIVLSSSNDTLDSNATNASAVSTNNSTTPVLNGSGASSVKQTLYGVVIAECVIGAILLFVAGFVYFKYRNSKKPYGRGGKGGKPAAFLPNGMPVWEMGQWRVIRAEDWASLKNKGDEYVESDDLESGATDVDSINSVEKKGYEARVTVEDDDRSSIACSIDNMKSFLPSARRRRSWRNSTLSGANVPTAIPDSEEEADEEDAEHSTVNGTESRRDSMTGDDVKEADSDDEEAAPATIIPFNYSMLSQLVAEEGERVEASSIHSGNKESQ
ncbi:hypothetical protein HDU96_007394 [Phlyctochytrium bullatum]|nr:hypothetical protein HDU96_007394 [Phlyctochytrium bullatum]